MNTITSELPNLIVVLLADLLAQLPRWQGFAFPLQSIEGCFIWHGSSLLSIRVCVVTATVAMPMTIIIVDGVGITTVALGARVLFTGWHQLYLW